MRYTRGRLGLSIVGLMLALTACGDFPTGEAEPKLAWRLSRIGDAAVLPVHEELGFIRLFDDNRVVAHYATDQLGVLEPRVFTSQGGTVALPLPPEELGARVTWYEDAATFGGYNDSVPNHGFVVVGGQRLTYVGAVAVPRGRTADGKILLEGHLPGAMYLVWWTPTGNALEPDIVDARTRFFEGAYQVFARLAQNGTIFLAAGGAPDGGRSSQVVLRDGVVEDIGYSQYNRREPVDLVEEAKLPCCHVVTIDRVQGSVLGIKNSRPVIRAPSGAFARVDEAAATPLIHNGAGDVLFQYLTGDARASSLHMRWRNKVFQFDTSAWIAAGIGASDVLATLIIDMNESGTILLRAPTTSVVGSVNTTTLWLAEPFEVADSMPLYADLAFRRLSGNGALPSAFAVTSRSAVLGMFTSASLTASVQEGDAKGAGRALSVTVNGAGLSLGVPIAVRTVPGGPLVTLSYADRTTGQTALASEGVLRVDEVGPWRRVTLAAVRFVDARSETTFVLDGTITLP